MGHIEFLDKGFENAVRKSIGVYTGPLSAEHLKTINGIVVSDEIRSSIEIPWQDDSSAFEMTFPNLMFHAADSENGRWKYDLAHFSHIATLHLNVPTEDLGFLQDFTKLKELYVKGSSTKDWTFLEHVSSLCYLHVRECKFHDLTPIRSLYRKQEGMPESPDLLQQLLDPKLRHLTLNYCGISDLSPLADCRSIEELNLSHNDISDIQPLKELKSLYHLTLRYNNITDISPLQDLRHIYGINVRHNQITDISQLSQMKSIRRLYLGHNQIGDYSPAYQLKLVAQDIEGYKEHYYKAKGWIRDKENG